MMRDRHSKALVFPANPEKIVAKENRKKLAHHSEEIQFLADCINYQQDIINKQATVIDSMTGGTTSGSATTTETTTKEEKETKKKTKS